MQQSLPERVADSKAMKRIFIYLALFFMMPLHAQQWRFFIDELQPAERPWMQQAQRILIVNNTVTQPENFGHSVAIDGVTFKQEQVTLTNAPLHCIFSATKTMEQSMQYEQLELIDHSQNTSDDFYNRRAMSNAQMRNLLQTYQADALLILNQLVLYNTLESFTVEAAYHYAYLQAYAQAHWTIYFPNQRTTSFATADTLLWESEYQYTRQRAIDQLPSTQEALLYLARHVGEKAANSLTPQWITIPRYLYDCANDNIQAGLNALRQQKWQQAINLWQQALLSNDKKAAAFAAANIAIAYEMMGDYVSACAYAEKSVRLFGALKNAYARQQQVSIRYYLEQLRVKLAKASDQ